MTTLPTTPSAAGPGPGSSTGPTTGRAPRRATRDTTSPIVGGVAAGLALHLGWPTVWVRAGFVVTAVMGFGIPLYAVLWLVLPSDERFHHDAPGLESASRVGKRPGRVRRLADAGPAIAIASAGFGFILLLNLLTGGGVLWPLILVAIGIALIWRQADEAQRERWIDATGRINPVRAVFGHGGWASYSRVFAGLTFIALAFVWFALQEGSLSTASDMAVAGLLGVLGLGIAVGPWVARLASDFTAERAERIRTQERADVAAHLHDSVLQTLALIQKNSHDAALVAKLARSQERDLRSWLYEGDRVGEGSVAAALRLIAAEIEDSHGATVEVVNVGDCPVDERLQPLLNAVREAVTNAAKHAGTDKVDVYAEVADAAVDVFVRDRGKGFELDAVAEDRLGVRNSILGRMTRHGGSAEVRSSVGEGTEVRLHMPRAAESAGAATGVPVGSPQPHGPTEDGQGAVDSDD
jgi:signal transduction histidine kinase/phage shock protein PspC (stress-responsive transcriptional regulator)